MPTACSSSAKAFAAAARQLALGTVDAAIVGGVDSLCLTTLYGFASLQLTSAEACRPYDAGRNVFIRIVGEGDIDNQSLSNVLQLGFNIVEEFSVSDRGEGGFGSTGHA